MDDPSMVEKISVFTLREETFMVEAVMVDPFRVEKF